ncbi:hypothetical protein BGW80DRAFT_1262619 [Lactifluus volemus]|nr:hypothetical protein BGW80DRAFT_1262619 [Lactifluus volemus]
MRPAISLTLFFLPLVSALTFTNITPAIPTSGGSITFSWTEDPGDAATVTFQLQNPPVLLNAIAIANNIQTASGQLTLTLPTVKAT